MRNVFANLVRRITPTEAPATAIRSGDQLTHFVWRASGAHQFYVGLIAVAVALLNFVPIDLQRRIVDVAIADRDVKTLVFLGVVYLAVIVMSGGASAAGSAQSSSGAAQHPPTAIVGQETQGKAASPEDVRRQTEWRPTTAQQGQSGQPTGQADKAGASAALDRARGLDRDGKEAECMDAVHQAKRLLGS